MRCAGIVAEYNPFHRGHAYQIAQTRAALGGEAAVVCAMSGHWVQQADCGVADKWTRARLALMGGADLVLELPTPWATASAERFARGGVELLAATGVVDTLSFGSECGEIGPLAAAAACLDTEGYRDALRSRLSQGRPFAVCRQEAVEELMGKEIGGLLRRPNNNLGVEYLRALRRLGSSIAPMTVLRRGAPHNSVGAAIVQHQDGTWESGPACMDLPQFASATQIRLELLEGRWDLAEPYLVPGARSLLENRLIGLPALQRVERAMLARVRTMSAEDWAALPDSGAAEGLPERLCRAGRQADSIQIFCRLAVTKRYTGARIQRLLLWAFLGITAAEQPAGVPYLRVLGMNGRGKALLREMRGRADLPVITQPAHAKALSETGRRLFELEGRCTDLYGLCFEQPRPCGLEWTTGPVVLEETEISGG